MGLNNASKLLPYSIISLSWVPPSFCSVRRNIAYLCSNTRIDEDKDDRIKEGGKKSENKLINLLYIVVLLD